ncbi:hypothetical protein [Streptomyces jeddahensis]|uniref:Streptomyces killer toxin-like beta/gamma crystallin domain-containing protein n=1 Tax=Streptomyces jeddahensis TaxID=1716141 RepID=A0A177HTR1_9ACTN|nr:hypothetical protein [Streptomyces jeddahensis]OAH14265.1 hypothetical protein STSP_23260 [Streptomyces jeddahensis]
MRRIASAGSALAITATALVGLGAAAPTASAADACYGGAGSYDVQGYYAPEGRDWYFKTSTNCRDINVKVDTSQSIQVCFYKRTDYTLINCNGYKWVEAGQWKVLAFNVQDNQIYKLNFPIGYRHTGVVAD